MFFKKILYFLLVAIDGVGLLWASENTLRIEDFLSMAQEKNLDVKIENANAQGSEARAVGIALPPPMVNAIKMKMEDGKSASGFEATQMLPFPGKLIGDYRARQNEEHSSKEMKWAKESEVEAQARSLFVGLWIAQEKKNVLNEREKIIQEHIHLARSTTRSDSSASLHLLQVESEFDFLQNQVKETLLEIRERQIQVAAIINMNPANYRPVAIAPPLTTIPLNAPLTEATHQVLSIHWELESLKARETEANSSWAPDFNFRYKEMGATSMFPRYKEFMVGITLPFAFFWEPHSQSIGAFSNRLKKEYEYEREKLKVETERSSLLSKAESLREQIELISEKLIPRAHKRMKVMNNLAPRDMQTLEAHLATMNALPELKMKSLELRMQYEEAVAGLNKYLKRGENHQ